MLSQYLTSELFSFLLVFCRIGSAMMLLPGFGEAYVSSRIRLLLALMFSLLLAPVLTVMPPPPSSVSGLAILIITETLIGLFFGVITRILIAAIHMGGMIIALQSSLASALTQDVTQTQGQASSLGNLLGMTALVLMFSTDLHHVILSGLADSYNLFTPGVFPIVGDFSQHAITLLSGAFAAAIQMAAPHIVIGTILYLGAGIIARLVPNLQIFFLLMAPQIFISLFILMVCFSAIMMWYIDYFRDTMAAFIAPR